MSKIYFWSDLHLGHEKIYSAPFMSSVDNTRPMRPFSNAEEADEYMIEQYNNIVTHGDKVYFLGDIAIGKSHIQKLERMKYGHKYLILGNHDNQAPIEEYKKYFNKIYGVLYMPDYKAICTHVPIHPNGLKEGSRFSCNIHGHLHDHLIQDNRYINVSVEQTSYKPIELNKC